MRIRMGCPALPRSMGMVSRVSLLAALLATPQFAAAQDAQTSTPETETPSLGESEIAALKEGVEPAVIDTVRLRRPVDGLSERDAAVIEFGRELFARHDVNPKTYARALKAFGERDLVDLGGLMAQQSADGVLTIAFDQHLPAGQKPLLPIP